MTISINYNVAKRFIFDSLNEEPLNIDDIPLDHLAVDDLPTGSVLVRAGSYKYNGVGYNMSEEGLYRFFSQNGSNFSCIVINYPYAGMDIYKFMSALSWNHVHGTDDNHSNYQVTANAGRYRKIRAQCGYIAGLCHWVLPLLGFTTRIVNVSTLETPLTGFDDGHIVVETLHGSDWRMWDITNGRYFRDAGGIHLSAQAFINQIANGGDFPEVKHLGNPDKWNSDSAGSVDLNVYRDLFSDTEVKKEAWYRRIFQA